MRMFTAESVLEAAKRRISWLFDEFPNVAVAASGGKDSTVTLELALEEARRRGRLPMTVLFIDQEAEWACAIDHVREIMHRPDVRPLWVQVPCRLFNGTSGRQTWLHCWAPGEPWMRQREPDSLHKNVYGTDRFAALFDACVAYHWPGQKVALLGGVRCEESPSRTVALTHSCTYKHATWGKIFNKQAEQFVFYPLYDWTWRDIWKAIHDHGWRYCKLYDAMFQRGVPVQDMRVSNLHHETAGAIEWLQEIEPATWAALTARLRGVNTWKHMGRDYRTPKDLPPMFRDWVDYRDHLLANVIENPVHRAAFRAKFAAMDKLYAPMKMLHRLHKVQCNAILANDWEAHTLLKNYESKPDVVSWRLWFYSGKTHPAQAKNRLITG